MRIDEAEQVTDEQNPADSFIADSQNEAARTQPFGVASHGLREFR
jgi:hypothetical protein